MEKCPICSWTAQKSDCDAMNMNYRFLCRLCGPFKISEMLIMHGIKSYAEPHIVSGLVRNLSENGVDVYLTAENIKDLIDSVSLPLNPFESIDLILEYVLHKAPKPGMAVNLYPTYTYPIAYARDEIEFTFYLDKAEQLGFLEPWHVEKHHYMIDLEGWKRLVVLRESKRVSNKAFIAMWFHKDLDAAWEDGFKRALNQTGYTDSIRIDLAEHNEKICDRILAEIRKSSLLVADFTGQRSGVFFEAGFALGLGLPVIWCCRDSDTEKLKEHFDTRQYNHIIWSTPEDLREKLINRIEATIHNRSK